MAWVEEKTGSSPGLLLPIFTEEIVMTESGSPGKRRSSRFGRIRLGAVAAVAIAAGLLVWLLVIRGDGNAPSQPQTTTVTSAQPGSAAPAKPVAATAAGLQSVARALKHPLYWAGPRAGYTYELTQTANGLVYIRYLPPGVAVGSSDTYLTIGTYPDSAAFQKLENAHTVAGSTVRRLPGGGLAVSYKIRPTSIYVAWPTSKYLVEVYDPSPAHAFALALGRRITSLG
jgi:hypothetical protein